MYTQSKKSRRRLHAIPAAIALSIVSFLWLVSEQANGEQINYGQINNGQINNEQLNTLESGEVISLLSANQLTDWQLNCVGCLLEPQYDVMIGDVVRLQSREEMVATRSWPKIIAEHKDDSNTELEAWLNWRWTVDAFVEENTLMRLTLTNHSDDEEQPAQQLHYVWDSGRNAGDNERLSEYEVLVVVNGKNSKAEQWQYASAQPQADWQQFFDQPLPQQLELQMALGLPGEHAIGGGFIEQLNMALISPQQNEFAQQVSQQLSENPSAAGQASQ